MNNRQEAGMNAADAEEYTAALGQVFSGGWRLIHHAQKQGVPQALGLTTEAWVRDRLGGYVKLAIEERREVVAELAEDGLSQREIAAVVGVDQSTVHDDLKSGDGFPSPDARNSVSPHEESDSSDGNPSPNAPDPPLLSVVDLETGAVVTEEPPTTILEVAESLMDGAEKDGFDRLRYRTALYRAVKAAGYLTAFEPEHVAQALSDSEKRTDIDTLVRQLSQWSERIDEQMGAGIRLVKGATS